MAERFATYAEFWPHYLREHSRRATRTVHFFGTGVGVLCTIYAVASQVWGLLALALIAGYGPAWIAHGLIERNRPGGVTIVSYSLNTGVGKAGPSSRPA